MLKHGDLSELYVLLARGVRPPPRTPHTPPLAAAQEPRGAPESLANGRLAHQAVHQGWLGGPSHRDGLGQWGAGASPRPRTPSPPASGGGLVYR